MPLHRKGWVDSFVEKKNTSRQRINDSCRLFLHRCRITADMYLKYFIIKQCKIWRAEGEPHKERLQEHKRISTSIKKNQAEPGECWPTGPSQSLLSGWNQSAKKRKMRGEKNKKSLIGWEIRKSTQQPKHATIFPGENKSNKITKPHMEEHLKSTGSVHDHFMFH